jgi:TRAP-type C4-dicarboxylate transport system permease small subunit
MIIGGTDLVISTLQLGQESPALGVKVGYVYLAVPISGFFLALYAVIAMLERLARLLGHRGVGELTLKGAKAQKER